tara:strand:+ start:6049 stop:6441 length:393 start_codon:yes stop_codon:yes gene_type:complete
MPNWIQLKNQVGDGGDALINLDSGMIVQLIDQKTKIWSLSGDRYLQGNAETFNRIQARIQRTTTVDYYSAINDVWWSNRVSNCFHAHGIEHVSDLLNKTEDDLLKMRYFGRGCLNEVIRNLANHNLTLSE